MHSKRHRWSQADVLYLRRHYPHQPTADIARHLRRSLSAVHNAAHGLGLHKTAEFLSSAASGRIVRGTTRNQNGSMTTRFAPGHATWNKGKRGWWTPAIRRTMERHQFIRGHQPAATKPAGSLRIDQNDGTLYIKVADHGRRQWVPLARWEWERQRQPIPAGHVIWHRNGDQHDCDIGNLECIPRAESMRRNSIHNLYPAPLARTALLLGRLKRAIRERQTHTDHR